ncbi:MAG: hypothetical protein AB3N07_08540 [Ruegeria sp.]
MVTEALCAQAHEYWRHSRAAPDGGGEAETLEMKAEPVAEAIEPTRTELPNTAAAKAVRQRKVSVRFKKASSTFATGIMPVPRSCDIQSIGVTQDHNQFSESIPKPWPIRNLQARLRGKTAEFRHFWWPFPCNKMAKPDTFVISDHR